LHNKDTGRRLEKSAPYFYFSQKVTFRAEKQGFSKNNVLPQLNKGKKQKISQRMSRMT